MSGIGSVSASYKAVGNNQYDVSVTFKIAFDWGGWNNNGASYSITCNGSTQSGTATFNISSGGGSWVWGTIATKTFRVTMENGKSKTISYSAGINTGVTPSWIGANGSTTLPARSWLWTVSYNANGGSGAPGGQTKTKDVTLTLSGTKPTRAGYTFSRWNTASNGSGTSYYPGGSYTANASVTLYAIWQVQSYTVTYNANGGSGGPGSQTKTHGQTMTISNTQPTRSNYNFLGWATSSGATTPDYYPGGSYTANSSITLYAVWSLSYTPPRITNLTIDRCDANSSLTETGTYARVNFSWASDKPATSIRIVVNGTTTNVPNVSGKTNGTVSQRVGGNLSVDYSYPVTITVTDNAGSSNRSGEVSPMAYIMDILASGKGIAFGKASSVANVIDTAWPIRCKDNSGQTSYSCAGSSTSWSRGRDAAKFKQHSINGYSPFMSIKTTNGSWEVGAYNSSGYTDHLCITHITDSSYNANNNAMSTQIRLYPDGRIYSGGQQLMTTNMMSDYIVASGSNANGEYRKWNSGRLEMWGTKSFSGVAINNKTGALYNSVHYTVPFPITSLTRVTAVVSDYSNTGSFCSTSTGTDMKTSVGFWFYLGVSSSSSNHTVHWKAEGTWK